jgi:hypothetical protein
MLPAATNTDFLRFPRQGRVVKHHVGRFVVVGDFIPRE